MVRSKLILLGYWRDSRSERWPMPEQFVDLEWDMDERELIVEYLSRGLVARTYMGYSPCRVCHLPNGALELSDGTYVWPDGLAHYLKEHGVKPPQEFIDHALGVLTALEEADREENWWQQTSNT